MSRRHLLPLALAIVLLALPSSAGAYVFWTGSPTGELGYFDVVQRIDPDGTGLVPSVSDDVTSSTIVANANYIFFESQVIEGPGPEELGVPIWIRTNLDGGERVDLPGIPFNTEAIAVDEEHIYWIEPEGVNGDGISRANLDGSDPQIDYLPALDGLGQYFAVYNGFVYWTYRSGDTIGRANLATKAIQPEFIPEFSGADIPEEPLGIAVDSQGIFWTYFETEGEIGHAGLGGGAATLGFIGPEAGARGGAIAIDGSDLYWLTGFAIAHAQLEGGGASVVDRHFVDDPGETLLGGLAVNAATSPPAPPPLPPPGPSPTPSGTGSPAGQAAAPAPTRLPPAKVLGAPKLKLDAGAGTATLTLAVPGPGRVVLSGAGIRRLRKTAKAAGPLTLTVRPSAKTAVKLKRDGKVKVVAKLTFTPPTGDPSARDVRLTLKLH
jgi:hypothetical protein